MVMMIGLVLVVKGVSKVEWVEGLIFGVWVGVGVRGEMVGMVVSGKVGKGGVGM